MGTAVSFEIRRGREFGNGRAAAAWAFDGALVDVNSSPASVLASIAGLDEQTIEQLIDVREAIGGFRSLAEMHRLLDLPWAFLYRLRDIAVFHPRRDRGAAQAAGAGPSNASVS